MLARRGSWICAGVMAILIGVARGDHRYDRDGLVKQAGELRQHGRELSDAFRDSYRSTPQYGTLQANAREIIARAGHLQSLARSNANFDKLQCLSQEIAQSHRLLVQNVRTADLSYGAGYPGPAWRYRNVSSRNPEVQRLLACMNNMMHQIDDEIAKVRVPRDGRGYDHHHDHHHSQPGVYGQTGLTISNGRLTLQIGR